MFDKTIIEEAQNGGNSNSSFLREYCAQFTDGSDSYYSFKKMEECTLKDERPHTLIKGSIGKKYILSIDPNYNESPSADYFAMSVMELDEQKKQGILVNCYAGLGSLNNHVKYLRYLLTNFKMLKNQNFKKAFTLIELMIVVVILGILMSTVLPKLT